MKQHKNPKWWTTENETAWDRVKLAFQRDWDQTKHDLGGDEPETRQNISHTVKQAGGTETIPPRGESQASRRLDCGISHRPAPHD